MSVSKRDSWVFLKKDPNKRPASGRFVRSNGRARHRYRRGQAGFESRLIKPASFQTKSYTQLQKLFL